MTIKQRKLAENLVNSSTVKEAMLKSGYAQSTANHDQRGILEGKALVEELQKYDDKCFQRYEESFDAVRIHSSLTEPDRITPDYKIRLDTVKTHFQVRGWLKNAETPSGPNVIIVTTYGSNDLLEAYTRSTGGNIQEANQVQDLQLASQSQKD